MSMKGKPELSTQRTARSGRGPNHLVPPRPAGFAAADKVGQGIYGRNIVMIRIFMRVNLRMKSRTRSAVIKIRRWYRSDAKRCGTCKKQPNCFVASRYSCVRTDEIYGVEHWILGNRDEVSGSLLHHVHGTATDLIELL